MTHIFAKISIFLSSLCVLHCLATPIVLILLPAMSTFFSETMEHILILAVVPLSIIGFLPTWLRHKNYRYLAVYVLSISMILFSQFVLHVSHDHIADGSIPLLGWLRTLVTFAGALLLAWVVYQNNRHTHFCTHPHHRQDAARPVADHQHHHHNHHQQQQ